MKKFVAVLALVATACASQPDKIQTASVSTLQYKDHDCEQLAMESDRVNNRVNELYHSLKNKADGDSAQMAIGMILFWPALFFLEGGDGPEAAEYAKLKGEREAIEKVSIRRKCEIDFPPLTPVKKEDDTGTAS
jgi:hypothetical protein